MHKLYFFVFIFLFSEFSYSDSISYEYRVLTAVRDFNRHDLKSLFNEAKRRQSQEDVYLMEKLFLKNDYLLSPGQIAFIKVNSANVILQSYKNGEYNNNDIVGLVRIELIKWVGLEDIDVKREAITLLGYYDDKNSFELLLALLRKQEKIYFDYALYSIYLLCDAFDQNAFREAYSKFSEKNKASSDRLEREHRQLLLKAGWCN